MKSWVKQRGGKDGLFVQGLKRWGGAEECTGPDGALLHGWISKDMLREGKQAPWAELGKSLQGLAGVVSL